MTLQIRPSMRVEALPEAGLSRLARFLASCRTWGAMPLDEVDGFFAALIAGPVRTNPHEHWHAVFGGDMNGLPSERRENVGEMLDLLSHHWHSMEDTLAQGLLLGPLLLEEEAPYMRGHAWASGFVRGLEAHRARWEALMGDEHRRAALTPMIELAKEPPLDSRSSVAAANEARRADLLTDATLAIAFLYRHFRLLAPPPAAPLSGLRPLH
jgi:uncharacterized protein